MRSFKIRNIDDISLLSGNISQSLIFPVPAGVMSPPKKNKRPMCRVGHCRGIVQTELYTSLFARKAAATSEKKHQTHNNKNKQTKEKLL